MTNVKVSMIRYAGILFTLVPLLMRFECLYAQEYQLFELTKRDTAVILRWEGISDTEDQDGSRYRDYTESFFRYGLEIDLEGYVYHPNLLEFTISGSLIQSRSDVQELEDSTLFKTTDNTYDVWLHILDQKPIHGAIYLQQYSDSGGKAFLGRYYNQVRRQGGTLYAKLADIPFELDINKTENRYASLTFRERNEEIRNLTLTGDLLKKEGHRVFFDFRYRDYLEKFYGHQYENTRFVGRYSGMFPSNHQMRFTSVLRYEDLNSNNDLSTVSLYNQFSRNLTRGLRMNVSLNVVDRTFRELSQKHWDGKFTLHHELFESLTSEAGVTMQKNSDDAATLKQNQLNAMVNYQKRIPTGRFSIHLDQRWDTITNRSNGALSSSYLDSAFDFSNTIVLVTPGIDPASIVVSDGDMTQIFLEGVDYQLVVMESAVYVNRLSGGNIPAGASVRISYSYATQPDYDVDIHGYEDYFQLRLLKVLRVGYRIRSNRNRTDSDFTISPFEEYITRQKLVGMESRYLAGQYATEDYEGKLTSFESRYWHATLRGNLGSRCRFSYTMSRNSTDFMSADHVTELENHFVTVSWVFLNGLNGDINFRDYQYTNGPYERNRTSILARFSWQYRKLIFRGSYEYILEDTDLTRRRHSYYILSIKRRF